MSDFETMPIGTRAAMRETAELLRSYERHHGDQADELERIAAGCEPASICEGYKIQATERREKAKRNGDAAAKLEALLAQPGVEPFPPKVERVTIPTVHVPFYNSGVPGDGLPVEGC